MGCKHSRPLPRAEGVQGLSKYNLDGGRAQTSSVRDENFNRSRKKSQSPTLATALNSTSEDSVTGNDGSAGGDAKLVLCMPVLPSCLCQNRTAPPNVNNPNNSPRQKVSKTVLGHGRYGTSWKTTLYGTPIALKEFRPCSIRRRENISIAPLGDAQKIEGAGASFLQGAPHEKVAGLRGPTRPGRSDRADQGGARTRKDSEDVENIFWRELRCLAMIRHPNVITCLGYSSCNAGAAGDSICLSIALEFMEHGSLHDVIVEAKDAPNLTLDVVFDIALDVLQAITYLHEGGAGEIIIHSDLKSTNILVGRGMRAKLCDFGSARIWTGSDQDEWKHIEFSNDYFSPYWTAPERFKQNPFVTGTEMMKGDMFSLGIVFWEMIMRKLPFGHCPDHRVVPFKYSRGERPEMPPLSLCPEFFTSMIEHCLSQTPEERPKALDLLAHLRNSVQSWSEQRFRKESTIALLWSDEEKTTNSSISAEYSAKTWSGSAQAQGSFTISSSSQPLVTTASDSALEQGMMTASGNLGEDDECAPTNNASAANSVLVSTDGSADDDSSVHLKTGVPYEALAPGLGTKEYLKTSDIHVLVVDDSAFHRLALKHVLQVCGYRASSQNSAEEALCILEESPDNFDLVMCDKNMPGKNGMDVVQHMKNHSVLRRIPIILVSVEEGLEGIDTAMQQGADDYLIKPVKKNMVQTLILKLQQWQKYKNATGLGGQEREGKTTANVYKNSNMWGVGARKWADEGDATKVRDSVAGEKDPGEQRSHPRQMEDTKTPEGLQNIEMSEIQLGDIISRGHFRTTTRGRVRNVDVAVKRYRVGMREHDVNLMTHEVELMSKLVHPNIVEIVGYVASQSEVWLLSKYMDHGSLRNVLDSPLIHLSLRLQIKIAHSIAKGLHYLHSRTPIVVHRDLKSANVVVSGSFDVDNIVVCLCDFGLSRTLDKASLSTRCGSPAWIAPEIMLGNKYDQRIDVYAYGLVLWEIMERKIPFDAEAESVIDLMRQVCEKQARPEFSPCSHSELVHDAEHSRYVQLAKRCWAQNQKSRPNMKTVIKELEDMTKSINSTTTVLVHEDDGARGNEACKTGEGANGHN